MIDVAVIDYMRVPVYAVTDMLANVLDYEGEDEDSEESPNVVEAKGGMLKKKVRPLDVTHTPIFTYHSRLSGLVHGSLRAEL